MNAGMGQGWRPMQALPCIVYIPHTTQTSSKRLNLCSLLFFFTLCLARSYIVRRGRPVGLRHNGPVHVPCASAVNRFSSDTTSHRGLSLAYHELDVETQLHMHRETNATYGRLCSAWDCHRSLHVNSDPVSIRLDLGELMATRSICLRRSVLFSQHKV